MEMSAECSHCGTRGQYGQEFAVYGKFNGYPAFKCSKCENGSYVTNAGRAMLTKKAKSKPIPASAWQDMRRMLGD